MAISPDHFAAPGKRVESAHEPGLLGTVLAWIEASSEIVVKWDSIDFAVVTYAHDLEPAESGPARLVHLMSADLLDACGKAPEGGGLTTTPVLGNVTCPDCKTLSVVPYREARAAQAEGRKYVTLGDIAGEMERMKSDGMTRASVVYALDRVYWEDAPRVTTHDSRCTLDSYHEGDCNVSAFRG